ncbi:hypothetical protein HO133_003758 [Letharia lupina]|uniref:Uncharacterized protein n=1 Tax=Letharia lupina TaxID=560253 RepID=A0A8H6F9R4_9LECA|nr:uncharacterized protein HO133_003758 [Letharia lupina]KAF6219933.1 hypothetical protein HO133_003758 [Letharia lupina]
MSNSASNSNDHKRSDFLPGLEDLGKLLKACSPNQGKKSDRSRIPDGKDCQICNIKDTCKTVVQASNELIEQGSSISEKETQHNKDQGMINPTRKPTQRQPKRRPKTDMLKTAEQANEGAPTKAAMNISTLGDAEGLIDDPDAELGN